MHVYVGDITKVENIDAIVNAANGLGIMGAGVAGAIAKSAGTSKEHNGTNIHEIVRQVVDKHGPFKAGDVYVTDAGLLKRRGIKYIYHAVTMKYPGELCSIGLIPRLLQNVLDKAIDDGLQSIAFGGLGCGVGCLDPEVVAKFMANISDGYFNKIRMTVVDKNPLFVAAFRKNSNVVKNEMDTWLA